MNALNVYVDENSQDKGMNVRSDLGYDMKRNRFA